MITQMIVLVLGWGFLLLNFVWPTNKWGGRVVKIAFSALSMGIFGTALLYEFLK